MKYIRTKDGRIFYAKKKSKKDVKLANDNLHWEAIPKGCNDYFTLDYEDNEIIKVADTIEELCDGFVIDDDVDNRVFKDIPYRHTSNFPYIQESKIYLKTICYGAIWTDKGLIYVAKMNEKGELELL